MRFCVGNVKNVLRRIARDVSAFEFVEASWTFKAYDHDLPQQVGPASGGCTLLLTRE